MKKITAALVIFSLLWGNFSAVYAQLPCKVIQGSKAVQKSLQTLRYLPNAARAANMAHTATLTAQVERTTRIALLGKTPKFEELRLRALQGRTSFLPKAILAHPVATERAELLRRHFVVAAPEASAEEITLAAEFWRTDLNNRLQTLSKDVPYDALADAAALGIFGTPEDLTVLKVFYESAQNTPVAAEAAAVWTRALAVHGQYHKLAEFFTQKNGVYPELQNGLAAYARRQGWQADIPAGNENTPAAPRTDLTEFGLACRLAGDPSQTATSIWLTLARRPAPVTVKATHSVTLPIPQTALQIPDNLTLSALEIPAEATAAGAPEPGEARPAEPAPAKATGERLQVFAKNTPQPSSHAGEIYGGIPLPALWRAAKQTWSKIKNIFTRKQTPSIPTVRGTEGAREAFQRLGVYMASYVMGLEVATPVIANFGSSFGLSLEENILVAVATYLPYSLGAFLSNWTKKVLGRRNSMNLGLALLGGGLFAGVTLCGLNGAFAPEADAMMHFYKALACITTASMGGVLVHNSVGPIMTELSKNASELVRQQRNTYTEFSRAIGMASSFAFPFLATKVLGMDWSLAFALPLPLVGAAALGVNLAKIPNTKPFITPTKHLPQAKGLFNAIKNNEYIRLFKEEKGVGAFLGGLFIMNAVETAVNSGFLFLLPSMTPDPSSQYLFGLAQFAAPFLLGRYLAGKFLQWFPKHNMSLATLMAAGGGLASLGALDNIYALTAALFLAETGISTGFTLGFARTAKNPATQDRVVSLIVASALSCAFGPLLLTNLAQTLIDAGLMSAGTATAAAMIGIPSGLAIVSAMLFKRMENLGEVSTSVMKKIYSFIKKSVFFPKQRRKRS